MATGVRFTTKTARGKIGVRGGQQTRVHNRGQETLEASISNLESKKAEARIRNLEHIQNYTKEERNRQLAEWRDKNLKSGRFVLCPKCGGIMNASLAESQQKNRRAIECIRCVSGEHEKFDTCKCGNRKLKKFETCYVCKYGSQSKANGKTVDELIDAVKKIDSTL